MAAAHGFAGSASWRCSIMGAGGEDEVDVGGREARGEAGVQIGGFCASSRISPSAMIKRPPPVPPTG